MKYNHFVGTWLAVGVVILMITLASILLTDAGTVVGSTAGAAEVRPAPVPTPPAALGTTRAAVAGTQSTRPEPEPISFPAPAMPEPVREAKPHPRSSPWQLPQAIAAKGSS